jgi:transposase-like protein
MKRRQWTSAQKARIVLEGLRGRPTSELCTEHQISQAQYYQWRDAFLANASKAFEIGKHSQREERLVKENARLKRLVADQALELKKIEEEDLA